MKSFSATGELPAPGSFTVLEASAGTGKTYAITGLACRLLADGRMRMSDLLLITFSRNATAELRARLHVRLSACVTALTTGQQSDDEIVSLICAGEESAREQRLTRLRTAMADFDEAMIATIHEASSRLLDELGIVADHDGSQLDDLSKLIREVTVDCYLHQFANAPEPGFGLAQAFEVAKSVIEKRDVDLIPKHPLTPLATARVRFAHRVREATEKHLRRTRCYTYHDMQERLRAALVDPQTSALVIDRLAERFNTVLVDEFQDTDPIQWQILQTAFVYRATVVVIGDPKQSIYGFRGGDVYTYLQAITEADRFTLDRNWRTDPAVVTALQGLFNGCTLGHPDIVVTAVRAQHESARLQVNDRAVTPLALHNPVGQEPVSAAEGLAAAATDVARWVSQFLYHEVTFTDDCGPRRLLPGDIAILVQSRRAGQRIRQELAKIAVPAAFAGSASVLSCQGDNTSADDWLALLSALSQPEASQTKALMLTSWLGWTLPQVVSCSDAEFTKIIELVRGWSMVLQQHGIPALLDTISAHTPFPEELLGQVGGERTVTDLRHIAQLLHARAERHPAALHDWLAEQIAEAQMHIGSPPDHLTRILETDEAAVQIRTIHSSKGLEFPVVLLPDLWDVFVPNEKQRARTLPVFHSPQAGGSTRMMDVGGHTDPGFAEHHQLAQDEERGEKLRLAYVGATRAQCHVGLWWVPVADQTEHSPLHRLLAGGQPGQEPPEQAPLAAIWGARSRLEAAGGALYGGVKAAASPRAEVRPAVSLRAANFSRPLDLHWRRTSYSGLTQEAHEHPGSREHDELEVQITSQDCAPLSPMSDLPAGAQFGTLVHGLYELADFSAADPVAELTAHATKLLRRTPIPVAPDKLAEALVPSLETPLGPLVDNLRLAQVSTTDRLNELDFELAVSPSRSADHLASTAMIADLMSTHLGPDDPLADYPQRLRELPVTDGTLRGYLTGSIDLVLRTSHSRYFVADYKTNWLGSTTPLTLAGYSPNRLATAMMDAHYPLQAVLYAVALHRFLRWRQTDYQPDRHLGGVLYLFVRGMLGATTPTLSGHPYGVFSWRPEPALVVALSDLLGGGTQ